MKNNQTNPSAHLTLEESQKDHQANEKEIRDRLQQASQNFFYPNSNVLKNKYRIKEAEILKEQCALDVEKAMIKLRQEPLPERFDSTYLKYLHKCLFKETFEWAGQTREKSFKFADGNVAFTSIIKKKEFKTPFSPSNQVEEGLRNLDQALAEKNYLKGLSREEFVEHAAGLMINLHYLHPFREGNRRTQRIFFEKLAEGAGHKLDFSLVTKKRKEFTYVAAMDNGNPEPMKHLLDDISNPEKLLILHEFTNSMRKLGLDETNYRLTVVAREGQTYHGTYRGSGENGFMMDVNGTFIVGNKKHLTPEQVKTLKIGDPLTFTVPLIQDQQQTLIPGEKVAPLTESELSERVYNSPSVQESIKKIETLCKIVYGNSHILQNKIPKIEIPVTNESLSEAEKFARQVWEFPQSIHRLRGINICGLKSGARQHAEENILPLSHALVDYAHAVRLAEKDVLESHKIEQERCEKSIEMPSEQIKNLFSLPIEQQQDVISRSPELRGEIKVYMREINHRLSESEHQAIKEKNPERLAKSIGTSVNQASEIIKIVKQGKELEPSLNQLYFKFRVFNEHLTSSPHHVKKENMSTEVSESLAPSAIKVNKANPVVIQEKANRVSQAFIQEKAIEQNVQQRKSQCAKVITI
ncbi:fido (protein-threonine AMPylation protein) [Bartonella callosciuri]|uniref:protein adenylyltransferase n=1 Tax=Bartonella callosciuri TaxID=686223 RepID=A0A840NQ65_9HYPH|nr:BID domain-containing T4SS effector [Bartonella callosciuri]MBB5073990.1 fido (protein-threonine AMPylation protein) [Bartonella callosciuri]